MAGKTLLVFLEKVFQLAKKWCGDDFARNMTAFIAERERLLRSSWRKLPPEDLLSTEKQQILREIDFDIIISNAGKHLSKKEFPEFLYDVSSLAIDSGELEKADRLLQLIIAKYSSITKKVLKANVHYKMGIIAFYRSNFSAALTEYNKSLRIYTETEDKKGISTVLNTIGVVLIEQGSTSQGVSQFNRAKKIAISENLKDLTAKINMNLGNAFTIRGMWKEAKNSYEEVLTALGNRQANSNRAQILHNLAIVDTAVGKLDEALEYIKKSIDYSKSVNNPHMKALFYLAESVIYCKQGDYASATALATTAFQLFSDMGDRLSIADVYKVFGMINRDSKRYDTAMSYFENSKRINEDHNNSLNLGETLLEMAYLQKDMGDIDRASESIQTAMKAFKRIEAEARIENAKEILTSL
ncbi:MAG: tetratricopeptide repeat protein [Candidatus Marinimicrobia bacterium]|nr:tetratricopeptide repeat protein [Candidatus Neomarinimicrobiota bacterium]